MGGEPYGRSGTGRSHRPLGRLGVAGPRRTSDALNRKSYFAQGEQGFGAAHVLHFGFAHELQLGFAHELHFGFAHELQLGFAHELQLEHAARATATNPMARVERRRRIDASCR